MPGRKGLIVVGLFWSALTCTFLVIVVYGIVQQSRALSFATTEGVVDFVKVTENSGSDSTTYGIQISYQYTVGDRRYTGDRLRYAPESSSDSWACEMAARFHAGSHPIVHYNPAHPAEAALIVGIEGVDLFLALFLTPFTMVMLLIWWAVAMSFRKPERFAGLRVLEEGTITRIRPSLWWTVGVTAITLGGTAFIAIFPVAFLFGGFRPPLSVAAGAWYVVLAVTALAAVATGFVIRSGARDITLLGNTLTTPGGIVIAYKDINRVDCITRIEPGSEGGESRSYEVWLNYQQGNAERSIKLQRWLHLEDSAREFAAWLREKVGVAAKG